MRMRLTMRPAARELGMVMPSLVTVVSLVVVLAALVGFFTVNSGPVGTGSSAQAGEPRRHPGVARSPHRSADPHRMPSQPGPTVRNPGHRSDAYVEVYNNSGFSGLAEMAAARLRDVGWQVVATDDWYGDIPQSTVYYPPGLAHDATELAADLDITRTWPAVSPMRFDRLTVILTSDFGG
jgi:LytR cell envelope-related transcriptional attenuator